MYLNTSPTPDQPGRWVVSAFGGPSVLEWKPCSFDRELAPQEVLVRILAAGIAGSDNMQRVGGYPDPRCAEPGFTTGYDCVGEVVSLGSSATALGVLHPGDRVATLCVLGAHATHIILPASELIPIDATADPVKIAALPLNYMTAWGMLKRSGVDLPPGSTILIGSVSGGVGTAVAQLVHAFDLQLNMIGTCSPSKFEYVRSLGVTPVDRNAPDLVAQIKSLTNGLGVDVAYDAVGSEDSLMKSYQATKENTGQVRAIGVMSEVKKDGSGLQEREINIAQIFAARLQPRSDFFMVTLHYYDKDRSRFIKDFLAIVEKVQSGVLNPNISRLLLLRDAVEAHKSLVSGKDIMGKMVFIVDSALAKEHSL
ncbi:hypothetical protein Daus18300_009924 [Diaporthe australafricana]|uniref:Enoyl reductase (ER) domain-containing protein n=1 Tax=Diaporthe australafricana TaxID=127596 RepID=A0ABR3WCE5_9PEZI